jgi:DNA polymerase eta
LDELQQKFGDSSGLWLYNIVRGIDNEDVILLKAPKSLMASKTIRPPITRRQDLIPWYAVLSGELHARVLTNWNENHSWPKTLSVSPNEGTF